ncbi:MAG: helix-turn-helix domain-containing protein [Actinomycetota bacterium]
MSSEPTPSGGRAAATRRRVAATALELFRAHGYDAVTTEDIARVAGINPRTFFRHFPTKADAVFFASEQSRTDLLRALYAHDPQAAIDEALIAVIVAQAHDQVPSADDIARYHLVHSTPSLIAEMRNRQLGFEDDLARWIAQRSDRPVGDFDVRVVAAALVAARRVVMEEGVRGEIGDIELLLRRALRIIDLPFNHEPPPGAPAPA